MFGHAQIGSVAIGQLPATTATAVPAMDWFTWLADPPRFPLGAKPQQQQVLAFDPLPRVSFGFFQGLCDPAVRTPSALKTAEQSYYAAPPLMPLVSFSWFGALAEPIVKTPPALKTSEQPTFTTSPLPFVSFGWFGNLSEPAVKVKPALRAAELPYYFPSPVPVVSFSWFEAFSEPPRFPRRLPTGEQQAVAYLFSPNQISISWWQPLTDPAVRALSGLRASLQVAFTAPARLLPTPTMTGTLAASETRDVLLFGGIGYNVPISATVAVTEIVATGALTAIIETVANSAMVAVSETASVPSSGSAVAPNVTASVAITEIRS